MLKMYSLSDAEILEITNAIDKADNAGDIFYVGWKKTFESILAQDGMSFDSFGEDNLLNPMDYGIPSDQATEITERMLKRARAIGVDDMTQTAILLEWMNKGPSAR